MVEAKKAPMTPKEAIDACTDLTEDRFIKKVKAAKHDVYHCVKMQKKSSGRGGSQLGPPMQHLANAEG